MIHVTHVIPGLEVGGAEMMLYRLLSRMDRSVFPSDVISLSSGGPVAEKIAALGVPVRAVEGPAVLPRLAAVLRRERPDVVHTWLYRADFMGGLAARLAGVKALVWSLHNSRLDPGDMGRRLAWGVRLLAALSGRVPARIVACSEETRRVHVQAGYAASRVTVIPNGFDTDLFRPDPAARMSLRREFGIPAEAFVAGSVARFHPHKDPRTLVRALGLTAARRPNARFLLCGAGFTAENAELVRWIGETGFSGRFVLAGPRDDVPRVMAALDALVCSSALEAFPLAVGEAMSCGVPCAATDVGDSALLLGDTGRLSPPRDPEALARACLELAEAGSEGRRRLGEAARGRIVEKFGLSAAAERYADIYKEVAIS